MRYTPNDVHSRFDHGTYERGASYHRRNMVAEASIDGGIIKGKVRGSSANYYRQKIKLVSDGQRIDFEGDCSCPVEFNCKHVVAVLLAVCASGAAAGPVDDDDTLPYDMSRWLSGLEYQADAARRQQSTRKPPPPQTFRLIYVLMPQAGNGRLLLHLCKGRVAADGVIRSATQIKDMYGFQNSPPAYLREEDLETASMYSGLVNNVWSTTALVPAGRGAFRLLLRLAEMAVLYLADDAAGLRSGLRPLRAGPARDGQLAWCADTIDNDLRLDWAFDDGAAIGHLLPTTPPLYLHDGLLGQLNLPDSLSVLPLTEWLPVVARAPRLAPAHAALFASEVFSTSLKGLLPTPKLATRLRTDVRPAPVLILGSVPPSMAGGHPAARDFGLLMFEYDGQRVSADPAIELTAMRDGGIDTIVRNEADEAAAWSLLRAAGLHRTEAGHLVDGAPFGELHMASEGAWLQFARATLPSLRARGWHIDTTPGFRYDLAEVDDWYAQVGQADDGAGSAWLDLELGIVVNGAQVPLLPVLVQMIRLAPRDFERATLDARGDDEPLLATLPGDVRVALPWGRVKPILRTLGELYFQDRIGDALRLPALDMARLAELEAGAQLRWLGGEHLRALGRKLAAFERVQPVAAPAGLEASLRPYQAEGLAWMQFLREYGLAGILADDMGLGKTIQTLSHILVEKEAGRLTAPALVVAPTSLMANWQAEAARFAPGLRVLTLTGPERLGRFGDMAGADLVLTSYALLPRDEEALRKQPFHLLILDESQYIKNNRSKAAQTAGLLQARHRLCLTGTPLQNHLGELWSQFHFLMPGLLGSEQAFNADFRKPVEKQGDGERNALLIRRIKPFLLRRTKDSVAKELPPKTEMVRMVDLAGAQRDLYETVRLAMDRKVREEIARKGVARSQIVILDALLKLRQVCCDPRLLKAAGARKTDAPSAKLQVLMELVDELLDEGRKLLVFSQFTSMLALIEAELKARAVPYALLTGDTADRAAQVEAFQSGAVPVFLISLKAGGVGLNLTAADTVIHYDPWWNPAAENQATDRAWRIGQDKPVFVYRLIAKGTLEEKIQELQRTKAGLADAVLAGGEMQGLQIKPEDLLGILSAG
ncbi:DEAD/DEAH box helicase [Duganella vulcania]|nr:DEAD/DEAH box helicase [Duganella vulcania]